MPYKKKSYARKKKVFTKRKSYGRRKKTNIYKSLPLGGLPVSKMVRLRLCEEVTLNSTALVPVGTAEYIINSAAASKVSGTGSGRQPSNFHTWRLFYDRYQVLSAKITLEYTSNASAVNPPMYYGIMMQNETDLGPAGFSSVGALLENKYAGEFRLSGSGAYGLEENRKVKQVTRYFSAKKWFREMDPKSDQGQIAFTQAALGSLDPSKSVSAFCWAIGTGGTTSSVGNNFLVTIDYVCLFSEPTANNDT